MKPDIAGRLADSVETATHIADGVVLVDIVGEREELYSSITPARSTVR